MIEILGGILTSVVGGGATGLLGVLLQRWFSLRDKQQDLEVVRVQLQAARETRQMELEHQAKMADRVEATKALEAELDAQARESEADERAYIASVQGDRATYISPQAQAQSRAARILLAAVDAVRGLMRPSITAYTLVLLTLVMLWVRDLYARAGLQMTPDQAHDLAMQSVGTVFYLATTTTVWWFGVRPGKSGKPERA